MTLQGSGLYFDIDKYLESNIVQPAFEGVDEACGEACFAWYKEYYEKLPTGIEGVECDSFGPYDSKVYDLQGRPVDSNQQGFCIKKGKKYGRMANKIAK